MRKTRKLLAGALAALLLFPGCRGDVPQEDVPPVIQEEPEAGQRPGEGDGLTPIPKPEPKPESPQEEIPIELSYLYANDKVTYGVAQDGTFYGWGANVNGSLGMQDDTIVSNPIKIELAERVVEISAGSMCLALTEEGNVYHWGGDLFRSRGDKSPL